jgi:serine/threonine protein kinase
LILYFYPQHCDIKPDNWVLVHGSSETHYYDDLVLVDFGRAIDLELVSSLNDVNVRDVVFTGEATNAEMMCVAMRQGRPWSLDLDTYGVCASAHVLLFGEHMQVQRNDRNRRFLPTQHYPLPNDLWTSIFDTLLNSTDHTLGVSIQPYHCRQLRNRIQEHLQNLQSELDAALDEQARILGSE